MHDDRLETAHWALVCIFVILAYIPARRLLRKVTR